MTGDRLHEFLITYPTPIPYLSHTYSPAYSPTCYLPVSRPRLPPDHPPALRPRTCTRLRILPHAYALRCTRVRVLFGVLACQFFVLRVSEFWLAVCTGFECCFWAFSLLRVGILTCVPDCWLDGLGDCSVRAGGWIVADSMFVRVCSYFVVYSLFIQTWHARCNIVNQES